jgi:hypothetical protein
VQPQIENQINHQQQQEYEQKQNHIDQHNITIPTEFHPFYCSPERYENYHAEKNETLFIHTSFNIPAHVESSSTDPHTFPRHVWLIHVKIESSDGIYEKEVEVFVTL